MIDLKSIAENALHDYLVRHTNNLSAYDVLEDDPEANLLSDEDYDKVAAMVIKARVAIKVTAL